MRKTCYILLVFTAFIFVSRDARAQQRERMVAETYYDVLPDSSAFHLSDSLTYIYIGSALRDSVKLGYDSSYRWHYAPAGGFSFMSLTQKIWTNGLELSDTSWYMDDVHHDYFYHNYAAGSYDSTHTHSYSLSQGWDTVAHVWTNMEQTFYAYDSAGRATERAVETWRSGSQSWGSIYMQIISYDALNRIVLTIDSSSNGPLLRSTYRYDSLGRLDSLITDFRAHDSLSWQADALVLYSYNSAGELSQLINYDAHPSVWTAVSHRTFTYDTHHNNTGYTEQVPDGVSGWQNSHLYTASFDPNDMIISYQVQSWDTTLGWIIRSGDGDQLHHYYYETYTLPSGISDIPSGDVRIYPVPASDILSIDLNWHTAQASTATIYDMSGGKLTERPLPSALSYHGYISVQALPAGSYIIQVKGEEGTLSRRFEVIK